MTRIIALEVIWYALGLSLSWLKAIFHHDFTLIRLQAVREPWFIMLNNRPEEKQKVQP